MHNWLLRTGSASRRGAASCYFRLNIGTTWRVGGQAHRVRWCRGRSRSSRSTLFRRRARWGWKWQFTRVYLRQPPQSLERWPSQTSDALVTTSRWRLRRSLRRIFLLENVSPPHHVVYLQSSPKCGKDSRQYEELARTARQRKSDQREAGL